MLCTDYSDIRLAVHSFIVYELLTQTLKGAKKPKLLCTFFTVGIIDVSILGSEGQS